VSVKAEQPQASEELACGSWAAAGEVADGSFGLLDGRGDRGRHGELEEWEGVVVLPLSDREPASGLGGWVVVGAVPAAAARCLVGARGLARHPGGDAPSLEERRDA
jgi:hypothetical protein